MKRRLFLYVLLCLIVCNVAPALAQQHIDQVVKDLEKKGVDVTTVVKRNDKKQIYSQVKSLSFISKDGNFARKLEEAFDKDAENASSESRTKRSGNVSYTLIFKNEKKKGVYVLSISNREGDDPMVNVSITLRDNSVEGSKEGNIWFDGDIFGLNGDGFQINVDSLKSQANRFKEKYKDFFNKSDKGKKLSQEI